MMAGPSVDQRWIYIALGDSTPAGFGVGGMSYVVYYADHIREDLGVEVNIRNFARSGETTGALLEALRGHAALRDTLGEAQVITLWTGWNDFWPVLSQFMLGGEVNLALIHHAVQSINANFDAILDEILSLKASERTIVRIADGGNPFVDDWAARGWLEKLQDPCFEAWRVPLVEAAKSRGFGVVHSYHAINGSTGIERRGDIFQEDGVHFNQAGHKLLAALHRQAGYAEVVTT
jgi:lysophospholipase L1-like esterase